MVRWDPRQYERYNDERHRPFFELVARVPVESPSYVVDLGCGPGPLTRSLLDRWPDAQILGVDSSPDMIDAAREHAVAGRLSFAVGDIAGWKPDRAIDVLVANAALHWVPGHVDLIAQFADWLAPGGAIAFQVPDNFGEPSHTLLAELRQSPKWRDKLAAGADRSASVERPAKYLDALITARLQADVWQTSYLHILHGEDPVLEWVKGTALRPVLTALPPDDQAEFVAEYAEALRAAYPATRYGTVFPFRRTFAVGRKLA